MPWAALPFASNVWHYCITCVQMPGNCVVLTVSTIRNTKLYNQNYITFVHVVLRRPRSAALFAFSTACSVETCDGLSLVFSRSRRSQCPRLFFALFAQQRSRFAIRRTDLRDDTVRNFQNVPMDPIPHQIQRIRLLPDRANARQQRKRTLRGLGIKRNAFPQGRPAFLYKFC